MSASYPKSFNPVPRLCAEESGRKVKADEKHSSPETSKRKQEKTDGSATSTKPAICFQCGLISMVPQSAFSARCHHCAAYISLEDVTLLKQFHKTLVQTRGDVTVKAGCNFKGMVIQCRNLVIQGKISGDFECSGTCLIKTNQQISGDIKAHTFIVEKRATVTLSKPVEANKAEINGTLNGSINAKHSVFVAKTGKILGDITTPEFIVDEGGLHFGHFTKLSPPS